MYTIRCRLVVVCFVRHFCINSSTHLQQPFFGVTYVMAGILVDRTTSHQVPCTKRVYYLLFF